MALSMTKSGTEATTEQGRILRLLAGWLIILMCLGLLLAVRSRYEAWIWMWLVGFTLFFGFKFLTLLRLDAACLERFSAGSLAGYLLLWPGRWFSWHSKFRPEGGSS